MPVAGLPVAVSGRSHILVFAFPLVKIITRGQLCQQLVRPVVHTCFRFFACKNRNAGAAMPAAGCASSCVRPVARTCFCFSACKNDNTGAAMPAAGQAGHTYVFSHFRS